MTEFELEPTQVGAIAVFVAIFLFESLFPFRKHFQRVRHFSKNVVISLLNTAVLAGFGATLNVWVFLWIAENGVGLLNLFEASFWVKALIASLVFDAWIYWWHRLNHIFPFLWRFHQVHHSDTQMDMSTALRFHPGEILLSSFANIAVFALCGITVELIVVYKIVFNINVLAHHSNIAISERWDRLWRMLLVSPNMHRAHHSMKVRETNSNYASILSIWDRLFGSYRRSDPSQIVFGLEYDRKSGDQTIRSLLKRPFEPHGGMFGRSDKE